jgi:hypothetical protein
MSSAPRGRGRARGGRGGFSSRGGRHATNGDKADTTPNTSIEDEGEVGQLKKQYGSKVNTIKEMFPDWTDEDVVFALQETDGDLEITVERITDGMNSPPMMISHGRRKIPWLLLLSRLNADMPTQAPSHSGEKFRRPRKIDPNLRSRMLQLQLSAIQPTRQESHAAVELALTVAEEAVVGAQIEEEVEEVAEHPLRIQTGHAARKMPTFQLQRSNLMHGRQLHPPMRHHWELLILPMTAGALRPLAQ